MVSRKTFVISAVAGSIGLSATQKGEKKKPKQQKGKQSPPVTKPGKSTGK